MTWRDHPKLRLLLGIGGFVSSWWAPAASAQTVMVARVTGTLTGGYDSDPFLSGATQSGAGDVAVSIAPAVALIDETGRTEISASFNRSEYFRRYARNDSIGAAIKFERKLSSVLKAQGALKYDDAIFDASSIFSFPVAGTGIGAGIGSGETGTDPSLTPDVGNNGDLGLLGQRQRRRLLDATLGYDYKMSARSGLRVTFSGATIRYPGSTAGLSNFSRVGASVGYTRQLSERAVIGVNMGYGRIVYSGRDTRQWVYAPRATLSITLRPEWTLTASAGVSVIRGRSGNLTSSRTTPSFEYDLCRATDRWRFCLGAARTTTAGGNGTVRPQTSVSFSTSYRLRPNLTWGGQLGITKLESTFGPPAVSQSKAAFVQTQLRRDIGRRGQFFIEARYQSIADGGLTARSSISTRAGVSFIVGDLR